MKKITIWAQIVLFCGFIALFFVLNLVLPDKVFSERENRQLTQAPKFTFSSLFSGDYTKKFESYTTDQFTFRDSWTTLKARSEIAVGKRENNDVYLCEDSLIERYKAPNEKLLKTNVNAVKSLSENAGVPVYFALIPGSSQINAGLLPQNAPNASQKAIIDYAYTNSCTKNIDIEGALEDHSDKYIFYRTDHHWTSLGAYYGYTAICEAMGIEPSSLDSFSPKTVTDEFYGTVYSKSGMSWVKPDSIDIFVPQDEGTQVINYISGEPEISAMYNYDYLKKKDKYSMFMGGITPLVKLCTDKKDAPSLLVIRDSYSDSLVPFLQQDFSEIHMMDLRYYKGNLMTSTVCDYIRDNDIDMVLVCYSVANFGVDNDVYLMGQVDITK